jgi:hypothetical protein
VTGGLGLKCWLRVELSPEEDTGTLTGETDSLSLRKIERSFSGNNEGSLF